eukprot:CAMPEP_0114612660 /NCGR_PEP_ID=MMETSP0168-20121206/4734_1 /TAXON_ID=95228 ORGANISM="Vannella sp., Strain DIVA3 517/6/12" /NCGR_SAMPLE_ID=MMETSP0168 /ASSEMBLY_ACC=CAM_ASM_000044 /LENGTH=537 /DNA_ID=CAMNT_0001823647 /DNA_START=98 /DNA_END=1711 /DNA_ORIENTATION=-
MSNSSNKMSRKASTFQPSQQLVSMHNAAGYAQDYETMLAMSSFSMDAATMQNIAVLQQQLVANQQLLQAMVEQQATQQLQWNAREEQLLGKLGSAQEQTIYLEGQLQRAKINNSREELLEVELKKANSRNAALSDYIRYLETCMPSDHSYVLVPNWTAPKGGKPPSPPPARNTAAAYASAAAKKAETTTKTTTTTTAAAAKKPQTVEDESSAVLSRRYTRQREELGAEAANEKAAKAEKGKKVMYQSFDEVLTAIVAALVGLGGSAPVGDLAKYPGIPQACIFLTKNGTRITAFIKNHSDVFRMTARRVVSFNSTYEPAASKEQLQSMVKAKAELKKAEKAKAKSEAAKAKAEVATAKVAAAAEALEEAGGDVAGEGTVPPLRPKKGYIYKYKTAPCSRWAAAGKCRRGAYCSYLHGDDDPLKGTIPAFKTKKEADAALAASEKKEGTATATGEAAPDNADAPHRSVTPEAAQPSPAAEIAKAAPAPVPVPAPAPAPAPATGAPSASEEVDTHYAFREPGEAPATETVEEGEFSFEF